ncbi:MAG: hypothetical protein V1834_01610 [Candidatus Micrarchaeota archaeon]
MLFLPAPSEIGWEMWLLANVAIIIAVVVCIAGAYWFYKWMLGKKEEPRNPRLPKRYAVKPKD